MSEFSLIVERIERLDLKNPAGSVIARARADYNTWDIARLEPVTPLERKLRRARLFRIRTTNDAIAFKDGTFPENGFAFASGWTHDNDHADKGMPPAEVLRLVRSADSYVTYLDRIWPQGFLNLQHSDGPKWFRDAAFAGSKQTLRLDLRLRRESETWMRQTPLVKRAQAFAWRHPLFFDIASADIVPR